MGSMISQVDTDYGYRNDDGGYYYYSTDDFVNPLSITGRLTLMLLAVALAGFTFIGIFIYTFLIFF